MADAVGPPAFESSITPDRAAGSAAGAAMLTDESALTKSLVRSDRPQFAVSFGASVRHPSGALVAGTRPGEWLLVGAPDQVAAAEQFVDDTGFTSIIGFTHGRALLRLTGSAARQVLAKVCNLDLSDDMTPDGAVVSAAVAQVSCDIIRDDAGSGATAVSYLLMADRSYGQYLHDTLTDAADEFT